MTFSLSQEKRTQQENLWAIAFSPETCVDGELRYQYFATCGGRHATLYEYDGHEFRLCQQYASSNRQEDFYAITFAHRKLLLPPNTGEREQDQTKRILCVGGAGGDILVIDIDAKKIDYILKGSLSSIFDLKAHTCENNGWKYNLLCSSTQDEVRLWNLDTFANVCMFAGWPDGHFGDVLSVAWHPTGSRIVSGGGDEPKEENPIPEGSRMKAFQICIWNVLDSPRLQEAIQASSHLPPFVKDRSQFKTHTERVAASVHNDVHSYIVDCVDWLGDLVLSKSTHNEIILWKPVIHEDGDYTKSSIIPIKKFSYQHGEVYFVKFAICLNDPDSFFSSFLAIGNQIGEIVLWDLKLKSFGRLSQKAVQVIRMAKKSKAIKTKSQIKRGLAFSPDGEALVGCDERGSVFLWKKTQSRNHRTTHTTPVMRTNAEQTAPVHNSKSSSNGDTINDTSSNSERAASVANSSPSSTVHEMKIVAPKSGKRKSISSSVPSSTINRTKTTTASSRVFKSVASSASSSAIDRTKIAAANSQTSVSIAKSTPSSAVDRRKASKPYNVPFKKLPIPFKKMPTLSASPCIDLTETKQSESANTKPSASLPGASPFVDLTETATPNAEKMSDIANPPNISCLDLTESKPAAKVPDAGIIDLTETYPGASPMRVIDLTKNRRLHSEETKSDAKPSASLAKDARSKGKTRINTNEASEASLSNNSYDAPVAELVAMGFRAAEARQALRDADGDMNRAVDWLVFNGSPIERIENPNTTPNK